MSKFLMDILNGTAECTEIVNNNGETVIIYIKE
jgi:hypothetical protein